MNLILISTLFSVVEPVAVILTPNNHVSIKGQ